MLASALAAQSLVTQGLVAQGLVAQAPNAKGLLVADWRKRNETAKALLEAQPAERNLPALIRALGTTDVGTSYEMGIFGGSWGEPAPDEPRIDSIRAARKLTTAPTDKQFRRIPMPSRTALVVPWGANKLASLVLCDHIERNGDWRMHLAQIAPDTREAARVWVRCKPSPEAVLDALSDERFAEPVARELWYLGDAGKDLLRHALVHGSPTVQRAVLDINVRALADTEKGIAIAVHHFVEGEQDTFQYAAGVVRKLGEKAVPHLAEACKGPDYARGRALAMLTVLGEKAAPAARALVDCIQVEDDDWSQSQALTALASIDIPSDLRAEVAKKAMPLVEGDDEFLQVLALDAIGNCKGGVDEETIAKLRKMLEAKPSFWKGEPYRNARLMACLQRLGSLPVLSKSRRRSLALHDTATIDTLLGAAVSDPAPAKYAMALMRRGKLNDEEVEALARAAFEWDAEVVHAALSSRYRNSRQAAFAIVRELDPDSISTETLLSLIGTRRRYLDDHEQAAMATAMLWQREGATKIASQVVDLEMKARSLTDAGSKFVRLLDLPAEERIERLEPVLRLGKNWDLVADADKAKLRKLSRQWIAEHVKDKKVPPYELRGRLCELGFDSDEDVELLRSELKADLGMLSSIDKCPTLPEALRRDLEALLDRDDLEPWHSYGAFEVLRKFANKSAANK